VACRVYEYSNIDAFNNYWGLEPPIFDVDEETSTMNWGYNLDTDPWWPFELAKIKPSGQFSPDEHLNKSITSKTTTNNISTGLFLERSGKIDDAITFYKNLIANDKYVRIALSQLSHIKYKYAKNEMANYFDNLLTTSVEYRAQVKKMLGDMYLQNDQFDNAISAYDDVIKNYSTEYDGISARFEKLFAYLHIKKDPTTAAQILSEIKGMNSKDVEVQMRLNIAENLINGANKRMGKSANLVGDNIPKTYGLYQNFPNPFNPSTTIRYQIPKPGLVTLKLYDILGREVATLVGENKIEGTYDVSFDASRFASGIYFYKLDAGQCTQIKKMILLK
jgi:hypothetical protein